jgi:hypothetical protein
MTSVDGLKPPKQIPEGPAENAGDWLRHGADLPLPSRARFNSRGRGGRGSGRRAAGRSGGSRRSQEGMRAGKEGEGGVILYTRQE